MKIKKVDDKPMVLHTKQKVKIHTHKSKKAAVKGSNIYTVDKNPAKKKPVEGKYRRSTVHQVSKKGRFVKLCGNVKNANQSIKVRNSSLYNAAMVGEKTATDRIDGGQELQQSAMIMYEASRPLIGTASRGAELFKRQAITKRKNKIKKLEAGKKIAGNGVKDTANGAAKKAANESGRKIAKETAKAATKSATKAAATTAGTSVAPGVGTVIGIAAGKVAGEAVANKMERQDMRNNIRSRKIKFFLDKMKAQDEQTDSLAKLVKDIVMQKGLYAARHIAKRVLPFLLVMVLLVSVVAIPVVAVVGTIYNSPFAIFLPPLEDGETVTTVAGAYISDFNSEVTELVNAHDGCDEGKLVYVNYEGTDAPSNYYDILAVYMVKHGIGDTATIMNDTSKGWLKDIVADMCSYTTSTETETETVLNEGGSTSAVVKTYLCVNVTLKTWRDMVSEYGFSSDEQELLAEFMNPDNLAMLGYSPGGGGGNMQSALEDSEIESILSSITDSTQRSVCYYALLRVGYPYSQELRDSGEYYDCSSLAYYSWNSAGVNISYGGATSAAAETQGLNEAGKTTTLEAVKPGDLIFYSTSQNGRYMNITHVAVYVGNGKVVEALNENYGVVYQDVRTSDIVLICSPN